MARFFNKNDNMKAKHLDPDSLMFTLYTTEEIKKLCMTKVYTPLMFDSLGHPLAGGLYDKTLGPMSDRNELCGTCFKNSFQCPGHFGYIELSLPVVNPLFHKTISSILKISCFSCYHMQLPGHLKYCLSLQNKLLNCGLSTEAIVIESKIQDLVTEKEDFQNLSEQALEFIKGYEILVEKASAGAKEKVMTNKNMESLRSEFLTNKLKYLRPQVKCMFCQKPLDRIQTLRNKIILSVNKSRAGELKGDVKAAESRFVTPEESRRIMREIWQNEQEFLSELIPVITGLKCENPIDMLYFDIIPVTPPNLRPVNVVRGRIIENKQSLLYKDILQTNLILQAIIQVVQNKGDLTSLPVEAKGVYSYAQGKTPIEKLNYAWETLQFNVDNLIDKSKDRSVQGEGLKQIIEKKAGLIRMHMMGKRVNFSARSVITPDPNLNIEEIGIPEEFAKSLTYPVPVTSWNVAELRKMILNGPKVHPGAVMVEYEDGSIKRINPADLTQQESIIKRLLTPDDKEKGFTGVKKVHRHLCNGDILLLNRQPTLHKPSIMAHTARILKGEKTLRLHYANCKAYNADFDGDEMNAHFPQNELARSEGYNLAHVCNQYLVPKDGTPLSGLIQDHVISGVRLSIRGNFFTKDDYQQLVFQGLSFKTSKIILLPPTIIKPVCLWSGKQVLSTVIINIIPSGHHFINLSSSAKINAKAWESSPPRPWKAGGTPFTNDKTMSEAEVIIRNGELLVGVLDKTHYGATPFGLVHCMYELYGGPYATKLLSAFAKLFTYYLQQRQGFTLGVQDILVLEKADKKRKRFISKSRKIGRKVIAAALDVSEDIPIEEMVEKIEEATFRNAKMRAIIDREYKSALDEYTNEINRACLPAGLISKFPSNNLQLMVQSGAKGSTVNTMQISCLLGQIELEGKRPPIMISGKSLPSFPASEFAPRAGGFIDGRFMTGIQPQEFFFHCMAGREGLIDTAVKTSRSGYLQRCLIKHLEGLTIGYDLTVRDSDRSVIQFLYGEDGMDILKTQFLNSKQMNFLIDNRKAIIDNKSVKMLQLDEDISKVEKHLKRVQIWKEKQTKQKLYRNAFTLFSDKVKGKIDIKKPNKMSKRSGRSKLSRSILDLWQSADETIKKGCKKECLITINPLNADLQPDVYYGSLSDHLLELMDSFKKDTNKKKAKEIDKMLKLKAMQSLCAPGEPVGLLAAQSIGEPSTQMTLNTFHFAGRGEMNVTLGIPRLREILMMASKSIKTPSMEIPFLDSPHLEKRAEQLRKALTRVTVADVLEKIEVEGELQTSPFRQMMYKLKFQFLPYHLYKSKYNVKPKSILKHMTKKFFGIMFATIRKYVKINSHVVLVQKDTEKQKASKNNDDEDEGGEGQESVANETAQGNANGDSDNSDEEPEDMEDAKLTTKYQQVHEDQEPEEEEREISDNEENEGKDNVNEEENKNEADNEAATVVNAYSAAQNYVYDTVGHQWCELTFALPLTYKRVDLTAILKEVANRSVVWETPSIRRAITYMKDDRLMLRTDGINIIEMFKYNKILDLNKLYSNDIHQVAETYGIEAAARVLLKEVQEVFKVYGIAVDPRHLLLIADYMTFNGKFEPLNRTGLSNSASPLQQMSFEASLNFLKTAVIQGKEDRLQSPSSCLMVGKPCMTGTGSFTLIQKLSVGL